VAGEHFEWLKHRSTSDILVLLIAGTICFSVLSYGAVVTVLLITQPDKNHAPALVLLTNTFQMLIGLLAGFIAGRTEKSMKEGGSDAEQDHQ